MFSFEDSPFTTEKKQHIPETAAVVFVSDLFVDDYVGGAELTSEALISSAPVEVFKLHSKDVTMELLQQGADRFWIFGNFTQMKPQFIPTIVANIRYSILEYDFKYCRIRSPEKHAHDHGTPCDCHNQGNGKLISAFFHGSMGIWWMSERQQALYNKHFPFLSQNTNVVLSSVYDKTTLGYIKLLRNKYANSVRSKWIILGSPSWIKGRDAAEKWCKDNNKDYEIIWNVSYNETLEKLAQAQGFVYLPQGGDTCPRMVIEARLLGCELVLNNNVLHLGEGWFD